MEPEERRLGRLAYEAYCTTTEWRSAITGVVFPSFDQIPGTGQAGWIAAALAVKAEMVGMPLAEYEGLREDSRKLSALEVAGVGGWEGYGDAMEMLAEME